MISNMSCTKEYKGQLLLKCLKAQNGKVLKILSIITEL